MGATSGRAGSYMRMVWALVLLVIALMVAGPAQATFPGGNGRIAYTWSRGGEALNQVRARVSWESSPPVPTAATDAWSHAGAATPPTHRTVAGSRSCAPTVSGSRRQAVGTLGP